MSSLISSPRKYRISFPGLVYVIIVVSFRIVMMSWFHSRENSFRFLQWSVTTTRPLSNGTIEPVSSLKSISTVWNRFCNRGQYCIGSNTRVIISPSLPSTGTILNNGTWASPTILGSTKGQYTYKEFNPFLRKRRRKYIKDGKVLAHFVLILKVLSGSLTDLSS